MELRDILGRYAEGFVAIDAEVINDQANHRTGEVYHPGFYALHEKDAVEEIDLWWAETYPEEFPGPEYHQVGVRYPNIPYAKCDHVFSTDGDPGIPEWAVEIKRIQLVGNNGNNNDYNVSKMLSPFLKDRSLIHDVLRMRENPIARRHAVVGYAVNYDTETIARAAELHPERAVEIANMSAVCRKNGGTLYVKPLLDFADGILQVRSLVTGPRQEARFEAWQHPCGGRGVVFGWEVRIPSLEPDYDPRHPW